MSREYLIGRSTTTLFDFSTKKPAPYFERPVPTDGLVYAVSKEVVPAGRADVVVLSRGLVQDVAARLKNNMDMMKSRLQVDALRTQTEQRVRKDLDAEEKYRAENPEETAFYDKLVHIVTRSFSAETVSRKQETAYRIQNEFDKEMRRIIGRPIHACMWKNVFFKGLPRHVDGYSTEKFDVDTGIPGNKDIGNLVPRLIFDLALSRELDAELLLNSTTECELKNAQTLLNKIEAQDLVGYLTFRPSYD